MQLIFVLSLLFVALAFSQCLEDVLTAQSANLSALNAWLQSEELVSDILDSANGVTLLALSNDALDKLYGSPLSTQLATDPNLLAAFLSYYVLPGVYCVDDFLDTPDAAAPSFMNMAAYSNVTGGQVVRTRSKDGALTFVTGNNAESNVQAYVCIQTLSTVHSEHAPLTAPSGLHLRRRHHAHHRLGADNPGQADRHAGRGRADGLRGCPPARRRRIPHQQRP
jgi:hypothetical protein